MITEDQIKQAVYDAEYHWAMLVHNTADLLRSGCPCGDMCEINKVSNILEALYIQLAKNDYTSADTIYFYNQLNCFLSGYSDNSPDTDPNYQLPIETVVVITQGGQNITLTTIGVSGPATLINGTLNIPNYSNAFTFNNGITNTAGLVQLGGLLIKDTTINTGTKQLTIGGTNSSGGQTYTSRVQADAFSFFQVSNFNGLSDSGISVGASTMGSGGDFGLQFEFLGTFPPDAGRYPNGRSFDQAIILDGNNMLVKDSSSNGVSDTSRGFVNNGDYEPNFVARSLVTKQYVDAKVVSGSVNIYNTDGALTGNRALSLGGNSLTLGSLASGGGVYIDPNNVATIAGDGTGASASTIMSINSYGIQIRNADASIDREFNFYPSGKIALSDTYGVGIQNNADYSASYSTHPLALVQVNWVNSQITASAGNYIQNQTAINQTANFKISGTGLADTSMSSQDFISYGVNAANATTYFGHTKIVDVGGTLPNYTFSSDLANIRVQVGTAAHIGFNQGGTLNSMFTVGFNFPNTSDGNIQLRSARFQNGVSGSGGEYLEVTQGQTYSDFNNHTNNGFRFLTSAGLQAAILGQNGTLALGGASGSSSPQVGLYNTANALRAVFGFDGTNVNVNSQGSFPLIIGTNGTARLSFSAAGVGTFSAAPIIPLTGILQGNGASAITTVTTTGTGNVVLNTSPTISSPTLSGTPISATPGSLITTNQIVNGLYVSTYYAPLASPAFTGTPTTPTPSFSTTATTIVNQAYLSTATSAVLATITGINTKTTGSTALYTVPSGKILVVTAVYVKCTAATAITAGAMCDVGVAAGSVYTNANIGVTTATQSYQFAVGGVMTPPTTTQVLNFTVNSASTGTAQTVSVILCGFLI